MNLIEVIILGAVQGLTEFLPISSSGHLIIFSNLIETNLDAKELSSLIIFLHLGTLLAVLFHYRTFILDLLKGLLNKKRESIITSRNIVLATIPALAFAVIYTKIEDELTERTLLIITTFGLFISGFVFILTKWIKEGSVTTETLSIKSSILIGLAQVVALLPGISRSGSTITAGRLNKLDNTSSVNFSFYMSLPIITAAFAYSFLSFLTESDSVNQSSLSFDLIIAGIITSAIFGYLSIRFMLNFLKDKSLFIFGIYCIFAGIISLYLLIS